MSNPKEMVRCIGFGWWQEECKNCDKGQYHEPKSMCCTEYHTRLGCPSIKCVPQGSEETRAWWDMNMKIKKKVSMMQRSRRDDDDFPPMGCPC